MAYIQEDDKQKTDQEMAQQGGAQSQPQVGGSQGVFASSGGGSQGPVGAGGQGGWTNIQNYLQANAGNKASSNSLGQEGKSVFDKEKSAFDTAEQGARTDAKSQVDNNKIDNEHAGSMVNEMGANYMYGGQPQNSSYNQNKTKFQNSLNSTYAGPQNFAYGQSADYQNMDSGLKNNFSGVMGGIYNKAAGGQIKGGQLALQKQLDQEDTGLQDVRNNLINQFSGFNTDMSNRTADADSFVKSQAKQYGDDQAALRNYLTTTQDQRLGDIDRQVGLEGQSIFDKGDQLRGSLAQSLYDRDPVFQTTGNVSDVENLIPVLSYTGKGSNRESAAGVDSQRNEYNSIADILNQQGGQIQKGKEFSLDPSLYTAGNSEWDQILKQLAGTGGIRSFGGALGPSVRY